MSPFPIFPGAQSAHGSLVPLAHSTTATTGFSLVNLPTYAQDLRIILNTRNVGTNATVNVYFNGDVGSGNYSNNQMRGETAAVASRNNSQNYWGFNFSATPFNVPNQYGLAIIDILNWQSSNWKTVIFRSSNSYNISGTSFIAVGTWRSTSAITSINFGPDGGSWVNPIVTAYGIRSVGK